MGSKRTGKANSPIAPWKHRVKADRRKAAEERDKVYRSLTPQQILANLDKLGLRALKERAKLQAKIDAQQKAAEPKPEQPKKENDNGKRTGKRDVQTPGRKVQGKNKADK